METVNVPFHLLKLSSAGYLMGPMWLAIIADWTRVPVTDFIYMCPPHRYEFPRPITTILCEYIGPARPCVHEPFSQIREMVQETRLSGTLL